MLDIGFAELLLLSVVGLMVLGPERLPKVARTLGGLASKARRSWATLKRSIDEELRVEELKKPLDDLKKVKDELIKPVQNLKKPFEDFQKDLKKTAANLKSKADEPVDPQSSTDPSEEAPENESPGKASNKSPKQSSESASKPSEND